MQIDQSAKPVYPEPGLFRTQDFAQGAAWNWLVPFVLLGRDNRDAGLGPTVNND